jgi:methylmalonyl-CoA/ethylmalonyl-CoA epimerase
MIEKTGEKPPLPFLDNGVSQIAFVVEDVERVVINYHRSFGIGPWHFYTYGKPLVKRMTYRGAPADYSMRVALSWFGPMRVELIQPLQGPSVYHEFVQQHGYGPHHFGVLVENMDEALAKAESAGYSMIMDGSGFGKDGDGHYAYIDTEKDFGVVYELIQRPAGRMAPEKIYPGGEI